MCTECNLVSGTDDPMSCTCKVSLSHVVCIDCQLLVSHCTHRCEVKVKVQRSGEGEEVSVVPCVCVCDV